MKKKKKTHKARKERKTSIEISNRVSTAQMKLSKGKAKRKK